MPPGLSVLGQQLRGKSAPAAAAAPATAEQPAPETFNRRTLLHFNPLSLRANRIGTKRILTLIDMVIKRFSIKG
jgi:hypothetical protein